jgi:mRNA interferase MazF
MSIDCKRGEVFLVNWNPGRGSEQTGIRPAVIIQNDAGNEFSPTTIVAACTTAATKEYPFIVKIAAKESGLDKETYINLAQIMTIDKDRLQRKIGELSPSRIIQINNAIKHSLELQ